MKIETKIYTLIFVIAIAISSCVYSNYMQKNYAENLENFKTFKKSTDAIISIKDKNRSNKKVLKQLKRNFATNSFTKKGEIYKIDFKELDEKGLVKLISMLMNSEILIIEFNIKKVKSGVLVNLEARL